MGKILTAQPFPFSHYDSEAGGYVPCGITTGRYVQGTPTQMMRLYWKVKSFSVSGSYTNYQFNDPTNPPQSASYSGTADSNATTELNLVCGAGTTSSLSLSGSIADANLDLAFGGSDFYFNSSPTQPIVKLYGNIDFLSNGDDTSGINTIVGGSLSAFTIDGFQVYEGGSPVNYNAQTFFGTPLITDFTSTIVASEYWSYGGTWNTSTGEPLT
jgi:hypothetical protein